MDNREFAKNDGFFIECCKYAEIPPTKRQASKYRNKKGLAYRIRVIRTAVAE
jgi:hypothetical protein